MIEGKETKTSRITEDDIMDIRGTLKWQGFHKLENVGLVGYADVIFEAMAISYDYPLLPAGDDIPVVDWAKIPLAKPPREESGRYCMSAHSLVSTAELATNGPGPKRRGLLAVHEKNALQTVWAYLRDCLLERKVIESISVDGTRFMFPTRVISEAHSHDRG